MIKFIKGHAYGNDFLYVLRRETAGLRLETFAQEICSRHTGVGADGLIVYEPTAGGASMLLFNADGSRAEVSGNGVRVLGALLLRDDPHPHAELVVETEGGVKRLTRTARDGTRHTFRAAMGRPSEVQHVSVAVGA